MCKDKRALFQVVDMSGSDPKTKLSFNPTNVQFWGWAALTVIALVTSLYGGIRYVATHTFQEELKQFHEVVKPEILESIETRIDAHKIEAEAPFLERIHQIETAQGKNIERMEAIQGTVNRNTTQLDRIDDKLDRLLEKGGG